ncbi:anti-sigma regulatory factor (Ser/Thr protein kinase) [Streptomyces sp. CEV 2-1]|uniref:ATP-binding protein n=1 Tax=unclassified Streptomyces TaxID=2593676 RepID=UPI000F961989|nr:ATP-binding protein [Streptomyces sp. CEV 2-1]ROQ76795.1 anti-sigma regulatory factor (Ser/Thr protein kinase) [Streptomyces sp. CEV 2-1]
MAEYGADPAGGLDESVTTPVPENAAAARDAVMRLLTSQFCGLVGEGLAADVVVADALLVTSELVTNAVRHGGGLTGFAAELTDEGLRLSVADASPDPPIDHEAQTSAVGRIGGYGWALVRRLAKQVSVTVHPGGKRIIALIPLT